MIRVAAVWIIIAVFFIYTACSDDLRMHRFLISNDTGQSFLMYQDGLVRSIPDFETTKRLQIEINGAGNAAVKRREQQINIVEKTHGIVLTAAQMAALSIDSSMQTMSRNHNDMAEAIRVQAQVAEILGRPDEYWLDNYYYSRNYNPAIVRWQDGFLMCADGWFQWINKDDFKISNDTHWGVLPYRGSKIMNELKVLPGHTNIYSDSRILVRSDNSLFISLSVCINLPACPTEAKTNLKGVYITLTHAKLDEGNNLQVGETILCDYNVSFTKSEAKREEVQKNWVPLEYSGEIYYIQRLFPLNLLKYKGFDSENKAILETVYTERDHLSSGHKIPWRKEYGMPLRGGTPAILVRGVYLTFFHTKKNIHNHFVYFMGAMTLCPNPPFKPTAMSQFPIAKYDHVYSGPIFSNPRVKRLVPIAYVIFPMGLSFDDDPNYLWLSAGYQDRDAFLSKLHIDGVFKNLVTFGNC